ncbi:pilin [Marinobacter sp.]|uniref:pilin n=1 Tax=Marinobacter sp. TaxID=50741 RepID=UPI0035692B77
MRHLTRPERGFTLIELMIVFAIIGILAAIATVSYVDYTARAKVGSALADVTPAKTQTELLLNRGVPPSDLSLTPNDDAYIGVPSQTAHCDMQIDAFGYGGAGAVRCVIRQGPPTVSGELLAWQRDDDGVWTCVTSLEQRYRPGACEEEPT